MTRCKVPVNSEVDQALCRHELGLVKVDDDAEGNIRQRSQEAIKFASGKGLTVSGEWVDINYPNIEANTITVNVSEGELYFDSATIAADSTISTGSGDVVF